MGLKIEKDLVIFVCFSLFPPYESLEVCQREYLDVLNGRIRGLNSLPSLPSYS